ncbi:mannose-1-phosphate guanylyltransferase/mannose-6-phosphate isomerase [Magnetospirillum fulvum]|uniref:mannose-1-phosphate guanylyltransferase n=1 Tax=Magnetospirillum fulvum TaxID=1082 RepID=A0A1H6H315_MAGFU|nr:mannose-1-phosphate guanylyltransferase/mannose-6-phosphate isomerase [Magnetospirillum fulvum]SEH30227.1 mannose-1-phosphate guanylyltransferase / mannose-6-phosphate isomerase [Magnetospirillum fulvum]
MADFPIFPVILSGGVGSRLWPISRVSRPKQLLPLCSDHSMLVETALRLSGMPPIVVCSHAHRFMLGEQMRAADIHPQAILLEPMGRNTAAAVAVAAHCALEADPQALLLVMPSDHVIMDTASFRDAVATAAPAAAQGRMVTFGITPTRPETGYGYIKHAAPLPGLDGVLAVDSFVEKPDAETAARYLADGGYVWNAGIFLFSARGVLDELARHAPSVFEATNRAWDAAERDFDFLHLAADAFAACPSVSVDVALMEKTDKAAVVPVDMGWSDVGAWDTLWEIGAKDEGGNVLVGDVVSEDLRNSYVRSEGGRLIAVIGLADVVVVGTDDAVLVTDRAHAQDVKKLVDRMHSEGRKEPTDHSTVYRPWGSYRTVDMGDRFLVKQIVVAPKAALSLQYHHHRAEHWIVVEGTARVICGDESFLLRENESTYIPIGRCHRLENPGLVPLRLIEVQSGGYLGEDDIVRVEDRYGRAAANDHKDKATEVV